ncbi:MAG: PAS domain S-box protein [Desulfobacteraceae bacterium]|nr:PAS domain S-box protein [Desulfobacteraceae bacterium]MCB9494170.1 PAS domain S-box protein [Desulfobacteraceae bacterium]
MKTGSFEQEFFRNIDDVKSIVSAATEVAVIAFDKKGLITLFNSGAQKMLGYEANELVGKKTAEIIHLDDEIEKRSRELSNILGREVKGLAVLFEIPLEKGFEQREWTYSRKDKSKLQVSVSVTPIYEENNRLKGFLSIAVDISKRKEFEAALKRNEKTIRDVADNIPGVLFQFYYKNRNEMGFHYLSPRTMEVFGLDSDKEKFTNSFMENIDPSYFDSFLESIVEALKQRKRWFFEGKFLKNKTEERWFQGRALPTQYTDEYIYNGVLLDITPSKKAEEKLKESEERFSLLLRASFGGIGIHDKGVIVDCNMGLSEITGYSREELIGMDGLKLVAEESRPLVMKNISTGFSSTYDVVGMRKDGTYYPVEIRGKNIPYHGRTVRVTEFRDIAERKKIEHSIRESEENLRATLNSIGEGVIAADKKGFITRMNPTAEKITGFSTSEAVGKSICDIIKCLDEKGEIIKKDPAELIMSIGETLIISECRAILSKDGAITQASCSGSPIRDLDQNITGIVIVIRDISEESKLYKQLQQSRKLEAIGQLAGGIAHDFNNMLSGIMGSAELMSNFYPDDPKLSKYCKIITDAASRAGSLTSKLLAFARKSSIVSSKVDLHILVKDAVSLLKRSVDKKIIIKAELNASRSIVKGDSSQLENIFLNLGINSSHAMPDGGELVFTSRLIELDEKYCIISPFDLTPGRYIEVEVRDTGTGIDHENLEKIFDPYFTTKENGRGTGLGLAAVYGIVQQHKGAVSVYSEKGAGTVFHIYLPIASGSSSIDENHKTEYFFGQGKILVIDDEEIIRNVAKSLLESLGYEVVTAENGRKGLEIFIDHHETIDLVILDMIMPEMNGRECFEEMKKISGDVKVVLASGFSRDEDINELKNQGLMGFLRKPFHSAELSRLIKDIVSKN